MEGGGLRGGWIASVLLGLLEGLTEFLPISSTGHLIVAGHFLGEDSEGAKLFEVVIQLGAIGAVCWEYRRRLFGAALFADAAGRRLAVNLTAAFIPAAVLGAMFHGFIKAHLFSPETVAWALMIGGVVIIFVERRPRRGRISGVDEMTWRDALWVGVAQATALFPGVSRAGATIVGGMLRGLDRRTATEFSFLLAVPTMLAAAGYDLLQSADVLTAALAWDIAVGFLVSFFSALVAIRALLRFVSARDFRPFGWYRIVFGAAVLLVIYFGENSLV